jgi:hypothetical protein
MGALLVLSKNLMQPVEDHPDCATSEPTMLRLGAVFRHRLEGVLMAGQSP